VFSFGGHPQTRGIPDPAVNLPWHWLEVHQLLSSILPDRLSILIDGAAAVLLALGFDAVTGRGAMRGVGLAPASSVEKADGGTDRGWVPSFALTLAVLACVSLLPRPLPAGTTTPLPRGWSAAFTALHLPPGVRVLVVPVPTNILPVAMRWQADTGHPASMVGGYFIGPGAGGQAYIGGNGVSSTSWYLDRLWASGLPRTSPLAGVAGAAGLATASPAGPAAVGQAPSRAKVLADLVA